jgi:hypothetical protein
MDPHLSEKLDPDPDPHQSEKQDQIKKVEVLKSHLRSMEVPNLGKSEL